MEEINFISDIVVTVRDCVHAWRVSRQRGRQAWAAFVRIISNHQSVPQTENGRQPDEIETTAAHIESYLDMFCPGHRI